MAGQGGADAVVGVAWEPHPAERELMDAQWPGWCVVDGQGRTHHGISDRVDVLVALPHQVGPELVAALPGLRLIHLTSHGVDALETPELVRLLNCRQVSVAVAAGAGSTIAEYVIMCMVALTRRLPLVQNAFIQHGSASPELKRGRLNGRLGGELSGSHLVLAGYGGLGRPIAAHAKALGMHVTAIRRQRVDDLADESVDATLPVSELDRVLPSADHLVLCVPLNAQTEGMFGADRLDLLPPTCCVVNVARGRIVDEHHLFEMLRSERLAGVASDVWSRDEGVADGLVPEPAWQELNLIATPHYSALTRESRLRALHLIGRNLARLRDGLPAENVVELLA